MNLSTVTARIRPHDTTYLRRRTEFSRAAVVTILVVSVLVNEELLAPSVETPAIVAACSDALA